MKFEELQESKPSTTLVEALLIVLNRNTTVGRSAVCGALAQHADSMQELAPSTVAAHRDPGLSLDSLRP